MSAEIFEVTYFPSPEHAPVTMLTLSADIADEKVLWIAGGDPGHPEVTLALADATKLKFVGTVHSFLQDHIELASKVQEARANPAYAKICALEVLRSIQFMRFDSSLSANQALDLAKLQTQEILEQDHAFGQQVQAYSES